MDYLQNIKMWCRNNLDTVGKWGGCSFLFGVVVTAFVFRGGLPSHAYVSDATPMSSSQSIESKLDFNPIGKINNITAPVNSLIDSAIKGFRLDQKINISTLIPINPTKSTSQNIDFSKFFSSSTVSSNDITSFLKEAAITGINLTILVISITTQILKGLLSVIR